MSKRLFRVEVCFVYYAAADSKSAAIRLAYEAAANDEPEYAIAEEVGLRHVPTWHADAIPWGDGSVTIGTWMSKINSGLVPGGSR